MNKRKRLCALFAALLCLFWPAAVGAQGEDETEQALKQGVDEVLDTLDLDALRMEYEQAPWVFEGASFDEAIAQVAQEGLTDVTAEQVLNAVFDTFKQALIGSGGGIAQIVVMLLVTGLLSHLRGSFGKEGVSQVAFWAGYVVICALSVSMLTGCVIATKQALDRLQAITESVTPILIALLTGMGGLSTSGVMSPVMAALTGSVFTLIRNVVFPAILVAAVLTLASHISHTIKLTRFSSLIQSGVKWFLGVISTVFLGVTAMKGLTGAALDGLSFKTAKYTVDKMIPIIGGMFSDTLDTLFACSVIVKNAVGVVGLLVLAGAMLLPLATLVVNLFLFRLGAAVAQPFADENSTAMLSAMGNITMMLFVVLLVCTAMAFISIALLMGTADVSMMMR